MNRLLTVSCIALVFVCAVPVGSGQLQSGGQAQPFFTARPLQGGDLDLIQAQSDAGTGLKMWTYHATSTRQGSKGKKYTGVMVGSSPFTSKGTTTITMQLVPLIFDIAGKTFDPTAEDRGCAAGHIPLALVQQSPIVKPANFTMNGVNVGKTQYTDAFQRANFWEPVSKNGGKYHSKFKVVTLKPITIKPGAHGKILFQEPCGPFGGVDYFWFTTYVEKTLIPKLRLQGVGPTTFPAFMLYNVGIYFGKQCCVGGWHGAYGSPVQTYATFVFDMTGIFGPNGKDTDLMSHEIAEWEDNPLFGLTSIGNPTPAWGHTGQVQTCQHDSEVGDPLTGVNFPPVKMPNGFTYHLQELAFFSWFYGPPAIGAGGKFSNNGTFTSAQGACKN